MTQEKRIIMWLDHEYGEGNDNVKIVREALEKQIPISPDFTDDYCDIAVCQRCQQYEFECGTTTWQMAYCPNCGQAIDWSGVYE